MASQPLVSIITPSYNQAQFLEATIRSVLSQEYPHLEYFVVDGGSNDGSLEIIQRYADRLAWWVSEPDRGQADAVNKGLKRATGDIVAWMNSDDAYLPGAVEAAVAALEANPAAGLVFGDLQSIDAQGKQFNTITYQQYTLADLLAFRIIGQPSVFMRRSVLEQTEYLSLDYHFLLDHHLWIQMAALAEMEYLPQTWAAARHHPTAKNVAQAGGFGEEVYRILKLAEIIQKEPKRVWGGAHRLNARYLLDGGAAWDSLKAYGKAFANDPGYTLKHWHRILYAVLSLFGLGKLRKLVQRY